MRTAKKILQVVNVVLIFCTLGAIVFALISVFSHSFPAESYKIGMFVSRHGLSQASQGTYTPIAPIPDIYGPSQTVDTKSGVPTLINNIFKTGVGLCTALAVLMIIYGGFKYISSEGFGQKSDAKDIISHALLGLLLALCIYLILFSVNQSLLSTDLFKDLSIVQVNISPIIPIMPGDPNYPFQLGQPGYGSTFMAQNPCNAATSGNIGQPDINSLTPGQTYGGAAFIDNDGDPHAYAPAGSGLPTDDYLQNAQDNNGHWVGIETDSSGNPIIGPDGYYISQTSGTATQGPNGILSVGSSGNGQPLNAATVPYVALPKGSGAQIGDYVLLTNNVTHQSTWAVYGDSRGSNNNGVEMSAAAATAVGVGFNKSGTTVNASDVSATVYPGSAGSGTLGAGQTPGTTPTGC